jgi:hypothetical protein
MQWELQMAGSKDTTEFYVYLHRRATDGKIFYVGKGKGRRAWNCGKRNRKWKAIYAKHGRTVEILFDGMTEKDALAEEVNVILECKYFGFNLANLTNGGDGTSGHSPSAETRAKLRAANLGKKQSQETIDKAVAKRIGQKRTPEQRAKMGKWCIGRVIPPDQREKMRQAKLGRKLTEDHKRKVGDAHKGRIQGQEWAEKRAAAQRKPVRCLNNGLEFDGLKSATEWLVANISPRAAKESISAVCRGKYSHYKGTRWEYI